MDRLGQIEEELRRLRSACDRLAGSAGRRHENDAGNAPAESGSELATLRQTVEAQRVQAEQSLHLIGELESMLRTARAHTATEAAEWSRKLQRAERFALSCRQGADLEIARLTRTLEKQTQTHRDKSRESQASIDELRRDLFTETRARAAAEQGLEERFRELAEMTRRLMAKEAETAQFALRVQNLRLALDRVQGSHSWKLTSPLRSAARWLNPALLFRRFRRRRDLQLVRTSPLFDAAWYLRTYPDVADLGLDPATHFLETGGREGRSPGPDFQAAFYLASNPDVARAGVNPLVHFIRYGRSEGRVALPQAAASAPQHG